VKLVSVAEMVNIEKKADASGHTYDLMMEHAGSGLGEVIQEKLGEQTNKTALGLVGSGNNGGDTLVALAYLATQYDWEVRAYIVRPRPDKDPLVTRVMDAGGEVVLVDEDKKYRQLSRMLETHDVLLDGILGTGVRLPLKGVVAKLLAVVSRRLAKIEDPPIIVAVDCPSGVDCDTGAAGEACLRADLTVTMAAVKTGLVQLPAFDLVGELTLVGIGLDDDLPPWQAVKRFVATEDAIRGMLPKRPIDAHKGTFGTALVVGGSINYTGAPLLSGKAAYRVGAGLVTLAVPAPLHAPLAGQFPEATWVLLPHDVGVIDAKAVNVVIKNLTRVTALAIGPGFGLEDTTRDFLGIFFGIRSRTTRKNIGFQSVDTEASKQEGRELPPIVIDADGLKLLSNFAEWWNYLPPESVLTPHPGEMSVLTGLEKDEIQANRLAVVEQFANEWGQVVVLKGACTVVAAPEEGTTVIPIASAALARAGTGDVLTGLIAGLMAQGVKAYPAAVAGAWIHGRAGLVAADLLGSQAAVLAGDVLDAVVDVLTDLEEFK
jgi:NAD(P)H-hydrate epimerase